MAIQRTVFTKAGVVVEVSMCEADRCDWWCQLRGYDGWAASEGEQSDPLREAHAGDEITCPKKPGAARELNAAQATLKRAGIEFVKAGARDLAKIRQVPVAVDATPS